MSRLEFEVGDEVIEKLMGKRGIIRRISNDGWYQVRLHDYPYTTETDTHTRLPESMKHTKKSILKKFFNGL